MHSPESSVGNGAVHPESTESNRKLEKNREIESIEMGEVIIFARETQSSAEGVIADGVRAVSAVEEEARLAGMSAVEIETIRKRKHIDEELSRNEAEIRKLASGTIERIEALIRILMEGKTGPEVMAIFKEHGINTDGLGSGVFYDTFEIEGTKEVLKILKLNYFFSPEQAVRMFARHAYEAERLRENFGDAYIPEAEFVVSEKFRGEFDAELSRVKTGDVPLYNYGTFLKIQLDRRLQAMKFKKDFAERKGVVRKAFETAGRVLEDTPLFRDECVGAMVEERLNYVTFQELMNRGERGGNCKKWDILQHSILNFIGKVRGFNDRYALMWHRFDSDNVVVEVDDVGEPTGGIKVLDLNFTEKSFEPVRKKLVEKMERDILSPLEVYATRS